MESFIKHYNVAEDAWLELRPYPNQETGRAVIFFEQSMLGGVFSDFELDEEDLQTLIDWATDLKNKMKAP